MKIENFKEKLTARCEKEYNAQPLQFLLRRLCWFPGAVRRKHQIRQV